MEISEYLEKVTEICKRQHSIDKEIEQLNNEKKKLDSDLIELASTFCRNEE